MSNDWRFAGRFLIKKVFLVFFPAMKTGRLFRCLLLEKGREGIKIRKGKYLFCAASYFLPLFPSLSLLLLSSSRN